VLEYLTEKFDADRNARFETTTSRGVLQRALARDGYKHLARYVAKLRWEDGMKGWRELEDAMMCVSPYPFFHPSVSFTPLMLSSSFPSLPTWMFCASILLCSILRDTSEEVPRYLEAAVEKTNQTRALHTRTGEKTTITPGRVLMFPIRSRSRSRKFPMFKKKVRTESEEEAATRMLFVVSLWLIWILLCSS
jgi:hypothetical protein